MKGCDFMGKNYFTDEQVEFLRKNKYVKHVSNKGITYSLESSNINNHKSIVEFSKKYSSCILRRILFSQHDISNDGMLELKPMYLAPIIIDKLK